MLAIDFSLFSLQFHENCLFLQKKCIMKEDADTTLLYAIGVVVVMFFVVFGFYLIKHSKKE